MLWVVFFSGNLESVVKGWKFCCAQFHISQFNRRIVWWQNKIRRIVDSFNFYSSTGIVEVIKTM